MFVQLHISHAQLMNMCENKGAIPLRYLLVALLFVFVYLLVIQNNYTCIV